MTNRLWAKLDTRKGFLLALLVLSFGMALLRLVRITFPETRVFDEVYSPAFAWQFLNGQKFFDVHPLLAELPQTIGLLLFGDTPLGWRFSPWLWGIVFTWGTGLTGWLLTRRYLGGVLAALLVSFDTAFFIYGRTGLPDMFLLSQLSLALACFFASIRLRNRTWAAIAALGSGVFLGNVVSAKWLGLAIVGSIWLWITLFRRSGAEGNPGAQTQLPNIPALLYPIAFLLVPALTYVMWLFPLLASTSVGSPEMGFFGHAREWHWQVWNYHAHLKAEHPYGSTWWQWPLLIHPVLFLYETVEGGRRVINATGNVVLWWSGFAALIGSIGWVLVRRLRRMGASVSVEADGNKERIVLWLAGSAFLFWLPWIFINRVSFNYHYFASFFFEMLLLAVILLWFSDRPVFRPYITVFLAAAVIGFVALYPIATGLVIPTNLRGIPFLFP